MNKPSLAVAVAALGCVFSVATSQWDPALFASTDELSRTLAPGDAPLELPLRAAVRATARFDGTNALRLNVGVTGLDVVDVGDAPAADPPLDGGSAAPAPQVRGALVIELLRAGEDVALAEAVVDLATQSGPSSIPSTTLFEACAATCDASEDFVVRLSLRDDAPRTTVAISASAELRYLLAEDEDVPVNDSFTLSFDVEDNADAGPADADAGTDDEPAADAGSDEEPAVDAGA
jgi:hypothetical protein